MGSSAINQENKQLKEQLNKLHSVIQSMSDSDKNNESLAQPQRSLNQPCGLYLR